MNDRPTDKPLLHIVKCARCGKAKNQHQAHTLRCPRGKRTPAGYAEFESATFAEPSREERDALLEECLAVAARIHAGGKPVATERLLQTAQIICDWLAPRLTDESA